MIGIACDCDSLPPHDHIYRVRQSLPGEAPGIRREDTGEIRIWVNWKEVARSFMTETVGSE